MRKLTLLFVSGMALLATAVAATPASAAFTDCDGKPLGIQGFHIATVPSTGGAIADLYGGGAACGQDFGLIGRKAVTQFMILTAGDMDAKNGPIIRCQNPAHPETLAQRQSLGYCQGSDLGPLNGDNEGPFVGKTDVDLAICPAGVCGGITHTTSWININKAAGTLIEPVQNNKCGPITVVACYMGADALGTGTSNITVEACWGLVLAKCRQAAANNGVPDLDPKGDRYLMTVYPTDPFVPLTNVFYAEIGEVSYAGHPGGEPDPQDMHVCGRANPNPLATECGTDDNNWVQKNGPKGQYGPLAPNQYKCTSKPEGYAVRVKMTNNATMPDGCSSIAWS